MIDPKDTVLTTQPEERPRGIGFIGAGKSTMSIALAKVIAQQNELSKNDAALFTDPQPSENIIVAGNAFVEPKRFELAMPQVIEPIYRKAYRPNKGFKIGSYNSKHKNKAK